RPNIYSLSLHDALPIYVRLCNGIVLNLCRQRSSKSSTNYPPACRELDEPAKFSEVSNKVLPPEEKTSMRNSRLAVAMVASCSIADRKSTRLNSSHVSIS